MSTHVRAARAVAAVFVAVDVEPPARRTGRWPGGHLAVQAVGTGKLTQLNGFMATYLTLRALSKKILR